MDKDVIKMHIQKITLLWSVKFVKSWEGQELGEPVRRLYSHAFQVQGKSA